MKNGKYFYYNDYQVITAIGYYNKGLLCDTLKSYENNTLTRVEVWLPNYKTNSSSLVYEKYYDKNAKPDNTVEIIDGKEYLWIKGKKHELIKQHK